VVTVDFDEVTDVQVTLRGDFAVDTDGGVGGLVFDPVQNDAAEARDRSDPRSAGAQRAGATPGQQSQRKYECSERAGHDHRGHSYSRLS
jgi:hypothetical protein